MRNRLLPLMVLALMTAACARGGEQDAGDALTDTTSAVNLTGDTTAVPAPVETPAAPAATTDSAAVDEHAGHDMTDSTTHVDSAAHP
jgi:hypothetical protein